MANSRSVRAAGETCGGRASRRSVRGAHRPTMDGASCTLIHPTSYPDGHPDRFPSPPPTYSYKP
eukprot:scaffold6388_cov103-Isochrysis_galbana.AAC.4